jgi:hypothetical protein
MNKRFIVIATIVGILMTLFVGIAPAQNGRNNAVICPMYSGALGYISPVKTRTDSNGFKDSHYFIIPEGVRTDTLQLLIWCYSAKGAAHLKISKFDGMCLLPNKERGPVDGTTVKTSADSTIVISDFSTESAVKSLFVIQSSKDSTFVNLVTGTSMLPPTAMRINVLGASSSNRSDTRYAIQLIARKFTNSL